MCYPVVRGRYIALFQSKSMARQKLQELNKLSELMVMIMYDNAGSANDDDHDDDDDGDDDNDDSIFFSAGRRGPVTLAVVHLF